jgi:hypothetical protein
LAYLGRDAGRSRIALIMAQDMSLN